MSHYWNFRSRLGAIGLCFVVLVATNVCCLPAQVPNRLDPGGSDPGGSDPGGSEPTATESTTSTPTIENPFDLVPAETEGEQPKNDPPNKSEPAIVESARPEVDNAQPVPLAAPEKLRAEHVEAVPRIDRVQNEQYWRAMIIDFNGPIFGSQYYYLNNRLDRAQRSGVDLVIIRLTSPGGLLDESVQIARRLNGIDWATTVAFIPEEAISGGAIIALGCDRIYMCPRGLIGDAGPIVLGPDGVFEHVEEKRVSYLHVAMRELAEANARPSALASAMADRSLKVFQVRNKATGEVSYLSSDQIDKLGKAEEFEVGASIPEAGENRFLTVNGSRAMELGLADAIFESESDMLAALTFEMKTETRMNWVDRTVYILNRPWLTGLLLFIALIALYIELAAPGISIAGLTSLGCFAIFFWSHALGGTSGWLEVLIFVLGVMCIIVEIFLLPGFGVFGLSGVLLVLLSLIMATQDFILPNSQFQWAQFQTNSLIVLGSVAVVGILFLAQLLLLDSLPGLKRFQLRTPEANSPGVSPSGGAGTALLFIPPSTEAGLPNVGDRGVAESVLRPSGKVLFERQLIDVVTEGDYLDPGTPVEVIRREGNRIIVRKL